MLLERFPIPLLEDLTNNRWLPFVGAGFSRNAELPDGKIMPMWDDLGKAIHESLQDYPYSGALDALSAYCHAFTRSRLVEKLHQTLLIDEAKPGAAHKAFCKLPFDAVCTTNFDFLLERQYEADARPFTPIINEDQLPVGISKLTDAGFDRTSLIKIHGDLNHPDKMIVTEDDYDNFLSSRPLISTKVGNYMIDRTVVLIGYSLDDPDLRQLWQIINGRLGRMKRPVYAITVGDDAALVAKYERRGIRTIVLPKEDRTYSQTLTAAFEELYEYWTSRAPINSKVTKDQQYRELVLGKSSRRICFFSAPKQYSGFLRDIIEPEISKAGFVLIEPTDVISPGDNISVTVDSVLRTATTAIIMVDTDWGHYEFRRAVNTLGPSKVLGLSASPKFSSAYDIRGLRVLKVTNKIFESPEIISKEISKWLVTASKNTLEDITAESVRLLDAGESRSALLSAVSAMEVVLRRALADGDYDIDPRASMSRMSEIAAKRQLIPQKLLSDIRRSIELRNRAAHNMEIIALPDAAAAIETLAALTARLQGTQSVP